MIRAALEEGDRVMYCLRSPDFLFALYLLLAESFV
jgi:hypothetical protein